MEVIQPGIAPTSAGPTTRANRICLAVFFLLFAALYLGLHGRDYDGDALKQNVWDASGPHVASVNHAYPGVWFWCWWKLGENFVGADFDDRMAWIEALNGLLGAGAATLGAATLLAVGVHRWMAFAAAALLGLSNAWFYHSTQATEPIMAQFWFMLSLRSLAAVPQRGVPAVVLCAVTWAVAVGAYQSYILAGPGLLWIVAAHRRHVLPWLAVAGVVGTGLYVLAAVSHGARSPAEVIAYLTTKTDSDYWGFIRPRALLQLPFGLANALTPPWPLSQGWLGLRLGWAPLPALSKAVVAGLVGLVTVATVVMFLMRASDPHRRMKQGLLLVFLAGMFGPFYLLPYYNKLWLLPLGALVTAAALVANGRRFGLLLMLALLLVVTGRNLRESYFFRASSDNYQQRTALLLETTLQKDDLLVCDGWDASNLFATRNPGRSLFRLISEPVSAEKLEARIAATHRRGGRVYVLGLLEKSEAQFALTDVATRGKSAWYPVIQSYKPKAELVWLGKEKGVRSDLYMLRP